jgi:hypothetical protein
MHADRYLLRIVRLKMDESVMQRCQVPNRFDIALATSCETATKSGDWSLSMLGRACRICLGTNRYLGCAEMAFRLIRASLPTLGQSFP